MAGGQGSGKGRQNMALVQNGITLLSAPCRLPFALLNIMIVVAYALGAAAQTHLDGELHQAVLDSSGGPCRVERGIRVPADVQLVIKDGCILFFHDRSGLDVFGTLVIQGSGERPVRLVFFDSAARHAPVPKENAPAKRLFGVRPVLRYSSGGAGVAGMVTGAILFSQCLATIGKIENLPLDPASIAKLNDLRASAKRQGVLGGAFFGLAVAGAIGFGLTFVL